MSEQVIRKCEEHLDGDAPDAIALVLLGTYSGDDIALCAKCLRDLANDPSKWNVWLPRVSQED